MDPIDVQVRSALTEAGFAVGEDLVGSLREVLTGHRQAAEERDRLKPFEAEVARLKPIEDEVIRLRPLADEGTKWRASEVERAVTEGKRAFGDKFAEETQRGILAGQPIEMVQQTAESWKQIGDAQFTGGRKTQDSADPTPIRAVRRKVPAAARS